MKKNIKKIKILQPRIRLLFLAIIGILLFNVVNAQTFVAKPATCISADKTAENGIMNSILDGEGKTGNAADGQGPGYFYWLRKDNPATFYINMNSSSKISAMKFYGPWGNDEDAKNLTVRFYNGATLLGTENLTLPNNYPNKYIIPLSQTYLNVTKVQFVVVNDWLGSTVSPNPRTSLEEIVFGDLVCNAGNTAPPVKDIANICPSASVNLNDAHTGTIPSGTSLVWYTNNTHTGTALTGTQVTQVASNGTYYAFYYDSVNKCYSPSSIAVNVIVNNTDSDGDGVPNMCDLDNDNDGILDSVECGATDKISNGTFPTSGGNTNTLTGWTVGGTYPASGAWVSPTGRINLNSNGLEFRRDFSSVTTVSQNLVQVMPGAKINLNNIYWIKTQVNDSTVKFLLDISYAGVIYATIDSTYGDTPIITAKNGASVNINTLPTVTAIPTLPAGIMSSKTNLTITLPYNTIASNGDLLLTFSAGSSSNQVRDLGMESLTLFSCKDTDNDSIPDYLDLDSDGDGCVDAIEGDGNFTSSQLTSAFGTLSSQSPNQNFGTVVDINGVPTLVGAAGQAIGESQDAYKNDCIDSDSDGYPDWQDLDDDNDGILDTVECPTIKNTPIFHLFDYTSSDPSDPLWLYKQTNGIGSNYVCPIGMGCSTAPNGVKYINANNVVGKVDNLAYDDGKYYIINSAGNLLSSTNIITGNFVNLGNANIGSGYKNLGYDNGVFYHWKRVGVTNNIELYKTTDPVNIPWVLMGTITGGVFTFNSGGYNYELKDIAVNDGIFYFMYYGIDVPTDLSYYNLWSIIYSASAPTTASPGWQNLGSPVFGVNVFNLAYGSEDILTLCDSDGDGIPNHLDLDSDNDGCPDAIEGGANFTTSDLVSSAMQGGNSGATSGTYNQPVIQNLGNTVGNTATTMGVPTIAGTGQAIGDSQNSSINNQCSFPCYIPAQTTGTTLDTNYGITALGRAGADSGNWPMVRKGAWTVLESKTKGFVVNRIPKTADVESIANPVEGMMVYDEEADCLKIYTTTDGTNFSWKCFNTPACPN